MASGPATGTWRLQQASGWSDSKQRLQAAIEQASKEAVAYEVAEAQQISLAKAEKLNTPWVGEELDSPPQRAQEPYSSMGKRLGDMRWIQTVVETLARQHNIPIDRGGTGRLVKAVAETFPVQNNGGVIVCGYASRQRMDSATAYTARLILQYHLPTVADRGLRSNAEEYGKRRLSNRPQLIWWNWDEQKWQSAAVVAKPDGTTEVVFGPAGKQIPNWRGAIPRGSGYWADQEFGTMGRQIPSQFVPDEQSHYTMLFMSGQGIGLAQMVSLDAGASFAISPTLYLAAGAEQLVQVFHRSDIAKNKWLATVRQLLGRTP